jgi:hypothetical protein
MIALQVDMGLFSSDDSTEEGYETHHSNQSGSTVTDEWIGDIAEYLEDGETVFHIIKSATISHGSGDADENESTATKLGKAATVAFCENRVVMKVPHYSTNDQFSIHYDRIQSVSFDIQGTIQSRIFTIATAGDTYKIGVHYTIDDEQVREVLNWLDKQISTSTDNSSDSRTIEERLEKIETLHKEGVISKSEYEKKREDILEDI